jgi:hypothetical protein
MSLLSELKRRNVFRMAGLYLVGAWLTTQVASTVFPAFELPPWALRGVISLLAIGFVPALIVAWTFELTPQGLRRDGEFARANRQANGPHDRRGPDRGDRPDGGGATVVRAP